MDSDFEMIITNAERTEVDLRAPVDLKASLPSWDATTFRGHETLHLRGIVDVVRNVQQNAVYDYIWKWDATGKMGKLWVNLQQQRQGNRIVGLQGDEF